MIPQLIERDRVVVCTDEGRMLWAEPLAHPDTEWFYSYPFWVTVQPNGGAIHVRQVADNSAYWHFESRQGSAVEVWNDYLALVQEDGVQVFSLESAKALAWRRFPDIKPNTLEFMLERPRRLLVGNTSTDRGCYWDF